MDAPTDLEPTTPLDPTTCSHTHTRRCWWDVTQARWSCSTDRGSAAQGPAAPPVRDERPLVDVRDMVVVHTAMLREFRLVPAAVLGTAPGDRARAAVVADHLHLLTDLLHHHHEGEDELLWPTLRARIPARAVALVDEVEEQHVELDLELGAVERLRVTWAADPTDGARDALVHHLGHLHTLLRDHLELEERALLPLAAAVLTEAEWQAVGKAGAAALPVRVLPLVFGMFAYEGDPAVVEDMLASVPRVARRVLPLVARRAYAHRARRVHGTARP